MTLLGGIETGLLRLTFCLCSALHHVNRSDAGIYYICQGDNSAFSVGAGGDYGYLLRLRDE